MTHLSRRQFLENSMLAAATAALAGKTRQSFAVEEVTGEKLRVAVVGVNGRGGSHIAEFGGRKDCEIAAIVDADEQVGNKKADAIEKQFGKRFEQPARAGSVRPADAQP